MIVTQTTPPAYLPLTTAEAKLHLRVDGTDEDALIAAFIGAAVDTCQQITGRSLMAQAWKLTVDDFADEIALPWPQVQAVQAVQYKDADGATQTLATSAYELAGDKVCLVPGQEWPAVRGGSGSVWINYTAGYSAGNEAAQQDAVPYGIKAWLLLAVGDMYAHREASSDKPTVAHGFADRLLDPFKVWGV